MPRPTDRATAETLALWGGVVVLCGAAAYVGWSRYAYLQPEVATNGLAATLGWDAELFANAAERVARTGEAYSAPAGAKPANGVVSPPLVMAGIGYLHGWFGAALGPLLKVLHVLAVAIGIGWSVRQFLRPSWAMAAFGAALFGAGLDGYGVTTLLAGNVGSLAYVAIFAALARGVGSGRWGWFHAAVALATLLKPPFATFWIVPVLGNGFDGRQARLAGLAAFAAAAAYVGHFALAPELTYAWLRAVQAQFEGLGDYGLSVYGATRHVFGLGQTSLIPYLAQIAMVLALLALLLRSKVRGPERIAALVVFAIVANPRMKEYDVAYASIPAAAAFLACLAPVGAGAMRRAAGVATITLGMLVLLKLHRTPYVNYFGVVVVAALAVVAGALAPSRGGRLLGELAPPAAPGSARGGERRAAE